MNGRLCWNVTKNNFLIMISTAGGSYDCVMCFNPLRMSDAYMCPYGKTSIGSDNGLSPDWHQAIIGTNTDLLLTENSGAKFNAIWMKIENFSFKQMLLKMSSRKWRPFCLSLNVLTHWGRDKMSAISQTIFSNAFSWMEMYEFRLIFWGLFLGVQLTIF